jgi:WD40 repeat protein
VGSENGPVIKPGQAEASLIYRVCAQTEDPKMPPKGDKLSDAEMSLLKNWIAGFALETATSKPAAAAQNQVALAAVSLTKPDGPPPMPGDLPLEPIVRPKANNPVTAMAASPWAPLVAIGGQKQVVLYNTELMQPCGVLPFPEGFPQVIRFSRNGQLLMVGGGLGGKSGKVLLWNVLTGERAGSVGDEVDQVLAADISPDHAYVALGGPSKVLKIYSTKDGKLLHSLKKHTEWITAISFSPDGKFLASADRNGGVMVWEGATGKEYQALAGHKQAVTSLTFMPGVLASASTDGKITLWNVKEGNELKTWNAHGGGVESIDFAPDGRLVSCGRDKLAKAWDQTGKNLFTSGEFSDIALRATLSNERVVAADWTGRIRAFGFDGKPAGELTANPPPIADQLAAAQKRLSEAEPAVPAAQKALADAEAKFASEKAAAEQRAKDTQTAIDQLNASIPSIEKRVGEIKTQRDQLVTARNTAKQALEAATKLVQEKEAAAAPDLDAAKTDLAAKTTAQADAAKKSEEAEAEVRSAEAKLETARKELPGKLGDLQKTAKETAATIAALNSGAPVPASAAAPGPVKDLARIAAAQKKLEDLTAEIARRREVRSKQEEGSAEYEKANAAVQTIKPEIANAEAELQAAQDAPPVAPPPKAPAPASKPHPLIEAVAAAKAGLDQANSQLSLAKADVERWTRAQSYMTVYRTEHGYSELKARYEELVATAKDALMPAERVRSQIADLEKGAAEGPENVKKAEAAIAQAIQGRDAANKAVADAQALIAEKEKASTIDPKAIEAEIAAATKKLEELNAEIARRREARAKFENGTPEYEKANEAVQAIKPEIASAEQAVAAGKAKLATSATKPAPSPELVTAQEALKKAQAEAKLALDKVAPTEQALAKLKQSIADDAKQLAELKQKIPEITAAATQAKAKAEQEAAALVKEVEKSKAEAQRVRADFDSKWRPNQPVKTASVGS